MVTRRALLGAGAALAAGGAVAGGVAAGGTVVGAAAVGGAEGGAASVSTPLARMPERPAPAIGSLIDTPRTRLIDGTVAEPGAWRGKLLLVQLWATWCPFCRRQNPLLDRLWRARRADGLELLGLSVDDSPDLIRRYVAEHDYRFAVARFDQAWWAAIGRPRGLPILWVIDRDSRLVQVEIGEMFPEDIEFLERRL